VNTHDTTRVIWQPPAPLAQTGWWTSAPHGRANANLAVAWTPTGDIDAGALRAAFRDLVARHEILRTRLVADGPAVRQEVLADHEPPLPHVDLSGAGSPDAELERLTRHDGAQPFELAAAPPWRATIARLHRQRLAVALPLLAQNPHRRTSDLAREG
jgi:hypothetical protein